MLSQVKHEVSAFQRSKETKLEKNRKLLQMAGTAQALSKASIPGEGGGTKARGPNGAWRYTVADLIIWILEISIDTCILTPKIFI